VKPLLDDVTVMSLVVAAAVHDFRHPGVTKSVVPDVCAGASAPLIVLSHAVRGFVLCCSNYLIATQSKLAIRYNDMSILENFHAAEAFRVLRHRSCVFPLPCRVLRTHCLPGGTGPVLC